MGVVEDAVAAVRAGEPIVLPTDTVYGVATTPHDEVAIRRIQTLKGRSEKTAVALVSADLDVLVELVPELLGRDATIARAIFPGPYTLVLANPARRFPGLAGRNPETLGVRVPALSGDARRVLEQVGAVGATSANRHGAPDPATLDDVPAEIRDVCSAVLDAGVLPGTPSTVIDFTGDTPRVLREGAGPSASAIDRALAALA